METDPGAVELNSSRGSPQREEPPSSDHQLHPPEDLDPVLVWVPIGRRLISGLVGLNVVLLGAALLAGQAFNPEGLRYQEPQVFILLLLGGSVLWMLWFLLWTRRQAGTAPHQDHHAGGIAVTLALVLFAAFSVLLYVFLMGYLLSVKECKPAARVISPFIEAPFLIVQTYFLWAHSKDCIHKNKIVIRSGLMLVLSADMLLWLNAVTEDTIHQEIELDREDNLDLGGAVTAASEAAEMANGSECQCSASILCLTFRKGVEVLYPFNMEFYLMAGCMVYVMWKNVGRRMSSGHHHPHHQDHQHQNHKLTLRMVVQARVGLLLGGLVLAVGLVVFVLYQVMVGQPNLRFTAFVLFYGYHLAVMPAMSLCSLAGMLLHRLERRASDGGHNPTRSLDVMLLVAAALGQLALSYFSLVAALAVGTEGPLASLDLSYSLLSLLELILQNIFIIEGLHRHPSLLAKKKKKKRRKQQQGQSDILKLKKKAEEGEADEEKKTDISLLESNAASPVAQVHDGKRPWAKRVNKEICAFLILSNVMLWVIPAFGIHPQFENGLGKQFFGFSAWFVLVNLGQPLGVFYRMHSVGALMELLLSE